MRFRFSPLALDHLDLSSFGSLVFAGGGNRCWWQAGVVSCLLDHGWHLPPQLVGTSGGAGIAASCITFGPRTALASCLSLYGSNAKSFEWDDLVRLNFRFAHQRIYSAWLASFLNSDNFGAIRASNIRLRVGFTRPANLLGLSGSILAGTLAYLVDAHLWHSFHPLFPRLLGLRQGFADLHDCHSIAEVHALLLAAAAAPPLIHAQEVGGAFAFDGGYYDNAPILLQPVDDLSISLVLLTRHYPNLPRFFTWEGRIYWQPSRPVPVSTWDCTLTATVMDAFSLGCDDTDYAVRANLLSGLGSPFPAVGLP